MTVWPNTSFERMNVSVPSYFVLVALGISGCDKRQEQTVSVAITRNGSPVANGDVRLYAAERCKGSFQAKTLREGKVSFSRTVEIGGVGVVTDALSVCLGAGEAWVPLFSSLHGPAPERIEIACDLAKGERKCTTRFDGRKLDEPLGHEDDA
jgi:hypothetical protein